VIAGLGVFSPNIPNFKAKLQKKFFTPKA